MGYFLLAIEAIAAGWLAIAVGAVFTGRLPSVFARGLLGLLTWLLVLAPFALLTFAALVLARKVAVPFLWPLLVVDIVLVCGALPVWYLGRRAVRRELAAEPLNPAPGWPLGWLGLSLAIALLLVNSTYTSLDRAVLEQLSDVRSEAETLAMSVAPRPIADRDNAAGLYVQLGDYFGRAPGKAIWPDWWDAAVHAADRDGHAPGGKTANGEEETAAFDFRAAEIAEFLNKQRGARKMILAAAAMPGCYFGRDYSRPRYDMVLAEIQDLRSCAYLLMIDARHRSANGDLVGALENVQGMYGIASHAAGDPLIVSVLVGVVIDRMAAELLSQILRQHPATTEQLAALTITSGISQLDRLERAFRLEEAAVLGVFGDFDQRGAALFAGGDNLSAVGRFSPYRVFVLPHDLASYRRFQKRTGGRRTDESFAQQQQRQQAATDELQRGQAGLITLLATPALHAATRAAAAGEASRRLASVGLALYRYRAAKGTFPDQLADLSPDFLDIVPRDPFDGKPIRWRKADQGYVLYSIGADLIDNGGKSIKLSDLEGDIVFECFEPAQPKAE